MGAGCFFFKLFFTNSYNSEKSYLGHENIHMLSEFIWLHDKKIIFRKYLVLDALIDDNLAKDRQKTQFLRIFFIKIAETLASYKNS